MIGETYQATFARAMFGSSRSALAPAVLWLGWISTGGGELSTTRVRIDNTDAVWGATEDGVANTVPLDGGTAGAWIIRAAGLWDAPTDGNLILSASLPSVLTSDDGQQLAIPAGGLSIGVSA